MVWVQREAAELERNQPRTDLLDEALRIVGVQPETLSECERLELVIAAHPDIEILDSSAPGKVLDFFADRLKVQQREAGVRHDLIDAVFALGGEDDLVRLLARVRALQAFVTTDEGANLLAGYKRAANILKKEGWQDDALHAADPHVPTLAEAADQSQPFGDEPKRLPQERRVIEADLAGGHIPQTGEEDPLAEVAGDAHGVVGETFTPEPAESALIAALDEAEPRAARAVEAEDFEGAMAALASLRAPIDAFFESVTVNDADPAKRQARLALLARMRAAVHRVADFSRIEG